MPLTPGARFGPYEITGALGAGGMGEVYRARDSKLKRDVALKVLPADVANDRDRLARFQREAEVLASLNHPHIAHIHGVEESNGTIALIMELVEGEDLAQRIARGPIPIEEALPIARQIAEALEAAHERGIIHRDLKPANIKVRDDGTVKVLDFGLAKAIDPVGGSNPNLMNSPTITSPARLRQGYGEAGTEVGVILGTAAYMAPEQAKGRAIDRRADVWAFGVVLFEMLTGKRAFDGADISEVLASVLKDAPSHDALPAATPIAIRRLLRRCLEKNPSKRLDSMAAARIEIDEAMAEPEAAVPYVVKPSRQVWRRAWPLIASGVVGAALIVTLGAALGWSGTDRAPRHVSRLLIMAPDPPIHIAVSPNGLRVAMIADTRLMVRDLSDPAAKVVTEDPRGPLSPIFSLDGESLVFSAGTVLRRVPVAGGEPVDIAQLTARPMGLSWAGDALLAGLGPRGIVSVSMSNGTVTPLLTVKPGEHAATPQMLPGGEAVLFTLATTAGDADWNRSQIVVQSLASGTREVVVANGSDARLLSGGRLVYAAGGVWFGVAFDPGTHRVIGLPVALVNGVKRDTSRGLVLPTAQLGVSTTGTLVYIPGPIALPPTPKNLVLTDRAGREQPFDVPAKKYESPRLSPDGRQLAVSSDEGQESVIWTYDVTGRLALRRLTFKGSNRFPTWSPDGASLAFQSTRDGDAGIFTSRADGTGEAERLTTAAPGTSHIPESWSRDGRFLSFSMLGNDGAELWLYSMRERQMTRFGDVRSPSLLNSAFSPDSRWIAYNVRAPLGIGARVYSQPVPATGALAQVSSDADNAHHPFWSPAGDELFYFALGGGQMVSASVRLVPSLGFGKAVPLPVNFPSVMTGRGPLNYDVTRDGRAFVWTKPVVEPNDAAQVPNAIHVVLNWFEELSAKVPVK